MNTAVENLRHLLRGMKPKEIENLEFHRVAGISPLVGDHNATWSMRHSGRIAVPILAMVRNVDNAGESSLIKFVDDLKTRMEATGETLGALLVRLTTDELWSTVKEEAIVRGVSLNGHSTKHE